MVHCAVIVLIVKEGSPEEDSGSQANAAPRQPTPVPYSTQTTKGNEDQTTIKERGGKLP